jgi:hypothetical protein
MSADMDSSMAHAERRSLKNLSIRQVALFGEGDNEYVNLEEMLIEKGLIIDDMKIRCSLSRSIFDIRRNYLKLRIKSKYADRYKNDCSSRDELANENVLEALNASEIKLDIEISINYPRNYPFDFPIWKLERFHGMNISNNVVIECYFKDKIVSQNNINANDWTPVLTPKQDIDKFIGRILDISNIIRP